MVVDDMGEVRAAFDRLVRLRDAQSDRDFAANVLARAVSASDSAEVIEGLADAWRTADAALKVALSEARAGGDR